MECRSLRESGVDLKKFDVVYFMASVDDAETNREFAISNGADFPVLSDPEKTTAAAYGVLSERGFASRWTYYIGGDGKVLHIDKQVDPSSAGKQMVEQLRQLGVGGS